PDSRRQFLSTKITCLLRAESLKRTRLRVMKMRTGTKHQDQFQKLASPHLASLRSRPNTTPPAATRKPRILHPPDRDITSMQLTISRKYPKPYFEQRNQEVSLHHEERTPPRPPKTLSSKPDALDFQSLFNVFLSRLFIAIAKKRPLFLARSCWADQRNRITATRG